MPRQHYRSRSRSRPRDRRIQYNSTSNYYSRNYEKRTYHEPKVQVQFKRKKSPPRNYHRYNQHSRRSNSSYSSSSSSYSSYSSSSDSYSSRSSHSERRNSKYRHSDYQQRQRYPRRKPSFQRDRHQDQKYRYKRDQVHQFRQVPALKNYHRQEQPKTQFRPRDKNYQNKDQKQYDRYHRHQSFQSKQRSRYISQQQSIKPYNKLPQNTYKKPYQHRKQEVGSFNQASIRIQKQPPLDLPSKAVSDAVAKSKQKIEISINMRKKQAQKVKDRIEQKQQSVRVIRRSSTPPKILQTPKQKVPQFKEVMDKAKDNLNAPVLSYNFLMLDAYKSMNSIRAQTLDAVLDGKIKSCLQNQYQAKKNQLFKEEIKIGQQSANRFMKIHSQPSQTEKNTYQSIESLKVNTYALNEMFRQLLLTD